MKLFAISQEDHTALRWQHPQNYSFAANQSLLPLVVSELGKAVLHFPIAWVSQGGRFMAMAVLGIKSGQNLFAAPNGRWLAPYVPASIRCYPFHLANNERGDQVLCVDTDSGLIGDTGEPFFAEGAPTPAIRDIVAHLTQTEQSRIATLKASAALQKYGLIVPWPITVQGEQDHQQIEGLFKVDEAALNQLTADTLREVRDAGGLLLAYCQLLSMQHLSVLGQLAKAHGEAAVPSRTTETLAAAGDLGAFSATQGETISFKNLW